MGIPRADLARSLGEYERKRKKGSDIFWTSWRLLPHILETSLATETDVGERAVLEDMLGLLLRKGLTMFRGVEPVARRFTVDDFAFYQPGERDYRWPNIPEPADVYREYRYEVVRDG